MDGSADLERGRRSYGGETWLDAFESLTRADQATPLGPDDLELLARSAYMLGRDDDYLSLLERAHRAYLDHGEELPALRCAFWIGMSLLLAGESARAAGWLGRAERVLERQVHACVERGYLLLPVVIEHAAGGGWEAAAATAAEAATIAERFEDQDLLAMAVHEQGHALVRQGRVEEGFRLLDETMVAVTGGELSPIVTGLVYCSVIAYCRDLYELRRAREWTAALTKWCERQPQMVAHNGVCLVHRAEIMELGGAWDDALEEARRAAERFTQGLVNQLTCGEALYRQGEVHRLRGEFVAAENAYREASRYGCEPQPGMAMLRWAQGKREAAAAAIRRALGETTERLARARLLPSHVEIMLAIGDIADARSACRELEELSADHPSALLAARSELAHGSVALAEGDPNGALGRLREACHAWQELGAPYELARSRVLVGSACAALGDHDSAALELEAARSTFHQLGAVVDIARLDSVAGGPRARDAHGLTQRELEVLRLVAAGRTNKEIAAELVLSERTVDRHISNIFAKLSVPSRAAATAYAYQHELL